MSKLTLAIDGVVIKEIELTKPRTTIGRRPHNDLVIDNLAVSGEHAVVELQDGQAQLEDLNSTNGTYVRGKAVKKQLLKHGDTVEISRYRITYLEGAAPSQMRQTAPPQASPHSVLPTQMAEPAGATNAASACIKVLSGAAAGREVVLYKTITTVGKQGVGVAAITRRPHGFVVAHVDGVTAPVLNGVPVSAEPVPLKNGDVLELAGAQMQFIQR